jgi:putative hydrolase of the HAD superfamily
MIRAIFLDFGDTLVSLEPSREQLFVLAARSVGIDPTLALVQRAYEIVDFHNKYSSVHIKDRDSFYHRYNEQLCEALGISIYFEALHPVLVAHFKEHKSWKLIEGVPQVLASLKQRGLLLALVANWDRDLPALAERLGISQFFSRIVSSQEVGLEKPEPAIFDRAVDELSLSTERDKILYVGNEYRADVLGARAAGLTPVLIDRSGIYQHADCLRFTSLIEWLQAWNDPEPGVTTS